MGIRDVHRACETGSHDEREPGVVVEDRVGRVGPSVSSNRTPPPSGTSRMRASGLNRRAASSAVRINAMPGRDVH